jgi:hypothetical protein
MPDQPERTGAQGIDLIKHFEGLRLTRYLDAVGKPTIGYGHLILPNERFAGPITASQAEALLKNTRAGHTAAIRRADGLCLQPRRGTPALVDLAALPERRRDRARRRPVSGLEQGRWQATRGPHAPPGGRTQAVSLVVRS